MSAPVALLNKMPPSPVLLSVSLVRAASDPLTHKVDGKVKKTKKTKKPSNKTTASGNGCASNQAKMSGKFRVINRKVNANPAEDIDFSSTDPDAPIAPARREKWNGKGFATLILEALRAATSTDNMLTTKQITAYIEEYRLTTDMKFPALPQTIRASILKHCYPTPKGLWTHMRENGKRCGVYKLLPDGLAADAIVSEDDEEGM
jgi:hypothetical protein